MKDETNKEYGGKSNAGKVMILFSDGNDLAQDIQPIEVSNLDEQFTVLSEDITNSVIYIKSFLILLYLIWFFMVFYTLLYI